MKILKYIFPVIFALSLISANAQTGNFELNNPNSIPLGEKELEILTSGYWRVYQDETESRGTIISMSKNTSICYDQDGTFFYNGAKGTWEIVEDRYIFHHLDKEVQEELNFGGVFSVTAMKDARRQPATLTLTKLLTSSHDMKRTLYLKSSSTLTHNKQTDTGSPYLYEGRLSEAKMDSLSRMEADELFDAGYTVLPEQKLHVIASDTLYVIRLDATDKRYQRIPLH